MLLPTCMMFHSLLLLHPLPSLIIVYCSCNTLSGLKYTPTSIVFINIPWISKFDWYPFSIFSSSAVSDQKVSVMIKCKGSWTNSLYNMVSSELDSHGQNRHIVIAIEGPYGSASLDFMRFVSDVLYHSVLESSPITNLSVFDILAVYQRVGNIGLFRGVDVGRTVIMELINNNATKTHGTSRFSVTKSYKDDEADVEWEKDLGIEILYVYQISHHLVGRLIGLCSYGI